MKKLLLIILLIQHALLQYGQIIADHTVVDRYDEIPQRWIDSVKTKLVWVSGMSHGNGYFRGPLLLEALDPRFSTEVWYHVEPTAETTSNLRIGRPYWGAENEWTSQSGINTHIGAIDNYNSTGNEIDVRIFGWSYQATWDNPPGGGLDPVYKIHWAGRSDGGPQGSMRWGLDAEDYALTGNTVCVDTYINAWKQYEAHFRSNGAATKMVFSTIIVDSDPGTEAAFQRELKSQHIRDRVAADNTLILFDFSDILAYNNAGQLNTVNWNDNGTLRPHRQIHPDNLKDYDANFNEIAAYSDALKTILPGQEDHIGDVGALRLGKAMWWMLARIAGWDGSLATGREVVTEVVEPAVVSVVGKELRIEMKDPSNMSDRISIHNLLGSTISYKDNPGSICSFSTVGLPAGIYFVVISCGGIKRTQKIFIE